MMEKLSNIHLAAWRSFITAHARLIDRINRELVNAEHVPLHWYDVLIELYEAPDRRLRMTELARKVVLSKSGLTRLVDKLEDAGLLTREANPEDGRGAYAVLTEAGVKALRDAWPIYAKGIQAHFASHMSEAEAKILDNILTRILASGEE